MRCLILGGTGFLGRHIGRAFFSAGYEVWALDRSTASPVESMPWLKACIQSEYADVTRWWNECPHPDVVVHLASSTVPATANEDPVTDASVNLVGALQLVKGLGEHQFKGRLLFASSGGAVYGVPQVVPLPEDHPTLPIGAYGVTKMAIEHHLRVAEAMNGLDYRVLRLSNPYGEWQHPNRIQGVIAVFAHRALHRQPLDVWGDGSVVRDFVYAADIGQAFLAAHRHEGISRIFNVGGGVGHSVNQIIDVLSKLLNGTVQRRSHPSRSFDPPINVLDIRKAREELDWQPVTGFEEGLGKTLTWLRTLP